MNLKFTGKPSPTSDATQVARIAHFDRRNAHEQLEHDTRTYSAVRRLTKGQGAQVVLTPWAGRFSSRH
jgi:hypothetical protein